jgi:hypothetical protein
MAKCPTPNTHRANRSPVFLVGELRWPGHDLVVRIRNISAGGVLVQGDGLPPTGTSLDFRRADLTVRAEVVWSEAKFAGLRFDNAMIQAGLLRSVPPHPPAPDPGDYRRPGFRPRRLSEAEQAWIRTLSRD